MKTTILFVCSFVAISALVTLLAAVIHLAITMDIKTPDENLKWRMEYSEQLRQNGWSDKKIDEFMHNTCGECDSDNYVYKYIKLKGE